MTRQPLAVIVAFHDEVSSIFLTRKARTSHLKPSTARIGVRRIRMVAIKAAPSVTPAPGRLQRSVSEPDGLVAATHVCVLPRVRIVSGDHFQKRRNAHGLHSRLSACHTLVVTAGVDRSEKQRAEIEPRQRFCPGDRLGTKSVGAE